MNPEMTSLKTPTASVSLALTDSTFHNYVEDDGEDERRKLFGFLRKHGNRLSGFAMWCGHAIIGMIPPMFSANGLIGVVVSTVLTSIFMITMFVYFIYLQGVKY